MVRYVFNATDTGARNHLWITDGTAGGTSKLSDVNSDAQSTSRFGTFTTPTAYASLGNGYAVFYATVDTVGTELWVTDGTAAGTALVEDLAPGATSSAPGGFAALGNGRAVFSAYDPTGGRELHVTDGTAAGTYVLTRGPTGGSSPFGMTYLGNGRVLFSAYASGIGFEPYVTDGTAAGTRLVRDLLPGNNPYGLPFSSSPTNFTALGDGRAVFAAGASTEADGTTRQGLWVTDGTAEGTTLLHGPYPGLSSSLGSIAALGGGKALFVADDGSTGAEPWITDGTAAGTRLVKDIFPGNGIFAPNGSLIAFDRFAALGDGRAVFGATDGVTAGAAGREPWVTDGTAGGTRLLKDVFPGNTAYDTPNSSNPTGFTALDDGRALFTATSGGGSGELWITDGTAAGTSLVKTVSAFGIVSVPGGKALFGASIAGGPGTQLWVTDGTAAGTLPLASYPASSTANLSPNNITALQFLRGVTGADPLFDPIHYLTRNPDVAAAGLDPYQHYLRNGYREGRNPDAYFDTQYYLAQNPDVAAAAANGLNPLLHFEQDGWREGRDPSAQFDVRDYLAANPDVAAAGLNPLRHFLTDGRVEGRAAFAVGSVPKDPLVDAAYYYARNPDVRAAGLDATEHYARFGWREGRNPDSFFDTNYYLSRNADVAAAGVNPLRHYDLNGWREGRDPSAQFSTGKYLAAYSDVRAAGVDPLLHFLQFGQAEGRQAFTA